ncbi:energy transducer TonB [Sphingobium sp.]|uniref:energy transducer TonB n=1 Tax=Sphingobium sp. TaxID=1912891 RepID=UPI003B3BB1E8
MLQAASRQPTEDYDFTPDRETSAVAWPGPVHAAPPAASRYGARSRPNLPAIIGIVMVHALLIGALIQVRHHVKKAEVAKLTVVNLSPPTPPPAAEAPPPPPTRPEIVAPPPIVQTPVPPVQTVQTTPDPAPVPTPMPVAVAVPGPPAPPAPPAPPSIVQAGDLGTQMVSGKPPRYPIESRRKHEQGTVVLTITLGTDGGVENIVVSQSSGSSRLDNAARDAVKGWRWKPTIRGGQPVRVTGVVEIPFILRTQAA